MAVLNVSTPARVGAALCAAEVLDLLGFATFQALVPFLAREWALSNAEAGWVSGIYLAGYVAAVPVLVALTDRVDARTVFAASSALGGIAALGFAIFADGLVSALAWRALAGVALAGCYMPGVKALSDRTSGRYQSRYVSFYTASFGLGVAFSFLFAGWIADALSWRWAFGINALGAAAAVAVVLGFVAPVRPVPPAIPTPLLDFRPVLRNRRVLGFILAYFGHSWELFAFRAWVVAFLAQAGYGTATLLASLATLLGVPASILGNELSVRIGRLRAIAIIAALSVVLSLVVGFGAAWPPWLLVTLLLIYCIVVTGDSAALTAGTVEASEPGRGGATLAAHAFLGFGGGALGPPAVGLVLDAVGGYGIGFMAMGAGSALTLGAVCFAARAGARRRTP
jgi:MFS family permease